MFYFLNILITTAYVCCLGLSLLSPLLLMEKTKPEADDGANADTQFLPPQTTHPFHRAHLASFTPRKSLVETSHFQVHRTR